MLEDWRVVVVVFSICILVWRPSSIDGATDPSDGQCLAKSPCHSAMLKSNLRSFCASLLATSGFCLACPICCMLDKNKMIHCRFNLPFRSCL